MLGRGTVDHVRTNASLNIAFKFMVIFIAVRKQPIADTGLFAYLSAEGLNRLATLKFEKLTEVNAVGISKL